MTDAVLNILRAVALLLMLAFLVLRGRRDRLHDQQGWWLFMVGVILVAGGAALEATEEFSGLRRFGVVGDTPAQSVLAVVAGTLIGEAFMFIGFLQWLPLVKRLRNVSHELAAYNTQLGSMVEQRTRELTTANQSLRQEIEERRRAENRLKASLQEKEVLLREVHHRVKNNMQLISSLLSLQADTVRDPAALQAIREAKGRVKAMAMIHERLYRSGDLAQVDFGKYAQTLIGDMTTAYTATAARLDIDVQIDDVALGIDTAIPCGLLMHELVSNSLKHAFPGQRRGALAVSLKKCPDDRLMLTVRDNGVGFPDGLDFRKTDSLGLQLVTTLAAQLKADIRLERCRGTTFTMTFTNRPRA